MLFFGQIGRTPRQLQVVRSMVASCSSRRFLFNRFAGSHRPHRHPVPASAYKLEGPTCLLTMYDHGVAGRLMSSR